MTTNPLSGHFPHFHLKRNDIPEKPSVWGFPWKKNVSTFTYCWGRERKTGTSHPSKAQPIPLSIYKKKKKKSKVDSAINTRKEVVDTEHDVPEIIIQILSVFPMYTVLFLCTHTGLPSFTKDYKPSSKPINPTTQGFGLAPSIICSPCALWVIKKE